MPGVTEVHETIRVIAAVITRGDRLLVCQRPIHKRHGGFWEFPGGKCEPSESDAAAAARELCEELDVQVTEVGPEEIVVADPGSNFRIAFVPVAIAGEPRTLEHSALRWCRLEELDALPLAPSDRQFVEYRLRRQTTVEISDLQALVRAQPELDSRTADAILGYDEFGLPR